MLFDFLFIKIRMLSADLPNVENPTKITLDCVKLWKTLWELCKTHRNCALFRKRIFEGCGKPIRFFVKFFLKESHFSTFCTKELNKTKVR